MVAVERTMRGETASSIEGRPPPETCRVTLDELPDGRILGVLLACPRLLHGLPGQVATRSGA